jgi:hypothetical protein
MALFSFPSIWVSAGVIMNEDRCDIGSTISFGDVLLGLKACA